MYLELLTSVDTEGSFVVERVAEMANALIAHLKAVADSNDDPTQKEDISSFSLQHILSRIHYFRVQDYVQQIAIVNVCGYPPSCSQYLFRPFHTFWSSSAMYA